MNGAGEYVVSYAPEAVRAKVARWRSLLIQRIITMVISIGIAAAIWYFFAEQIGWFGPWLVGSAVVGGLVWVIVSVTGFLLTRRDGREVIGGPAFAVTPAGVWSAGLWLTWPEVGSFQAPPGRFGRSPRLLVQGRDGRASAVPMEYLSALPASLDSAVRALSGGRCWIDLSRLDD